MARWPGRLEEAEGGGMPRAWGWRDRQPSSPAAATDTPAKILLLRLKKEKLQSQIPD